MKNTNTQRGNTQNSHCQNNCHCRMFLSAISTSDDKSGADPRTLWAAFSSGRTNKNNCHAESSLLSISTAGKEQGRDPEHKLFRMTSLKGITRGFTLIELLVVVLIIGILAAIALPQYQKAVEKSRMTEAMMHINTIKKAISLYMLEHGLPQDTTDMLDGKLDIALPLSSEVDVSGLVFNLTGGVSHYCTEGFCYGAACASDSCSVEVVRYPSDNYKIAAFMGNDNQWLDVFYPCSSMGEKMYNSVKHLGYEQYSC